MNAIIDDWNHLRDFLALAREGTLAKAGAHRDIDPTTVFRHLHALERELGSSLFERRGRGYVLTANGESLVDHASRVEEEVHLLERTMAGRDQALTGSIRVTTTDTIAERLVAPHLPGFYKAFPGIRIDLVLDDRIFRLGRGEADVALRPDTRTTEADVVPRLLSPMQSAFYASEQYLAEAGWPRRRADLKKHRLVDLDESLAHVPYARFVLRFGPISNVVFRSSSFLGVAMAIERGIGIGVAPCFLMDERPSIVRLFGREPDLESALWLLVHRDLRRMARVRAFVDFMTEAIEGARDLLEGRRGQRARKAQP